MLQEVAHRYKSTICNLIFVYTVGYEL